MRAPIDSPTGGGPARKAARLRRASEVPVVLLLVVTLGGAWCGGRTPSIPVDAAERMVLTADDVPAGFVEFEGRELLRGDAPRGEGGWVARFRPSNPEQRDGPLVIESRVDVFADVPGARRGFRDARKAMRTAVAAGVEGSGELRAPAIGDEGVAATVLQAGSPEEVRTFLVTWRFRNVVGSLVANGFEGRLARDEVLRLADRQQRRIREAADG